MAWISIYLSIFSSPTVVIICVARQKQSHRFRVKGTTRHTQGETRQIYGVEYVLRFGIVILCVTFEMPRHAYNWKCISFEFIPYYSFNWQLHWKCTQSDVSSQITKPLCTVNIETGQEINVPKKCGKKERALHKKQ